MSVTHSVNTDLGFITFEPDANTPIFDQVTVKPTHVSHVSNAPYDVTVTLDNGSGSSEVYTFSFIVKPECVNGRAWKPIFWPDKVRQDGESEDPLDEVLPVKFTVPDKLQTDEYGDWSTVCEEAAISLIGQPSYVTFDSGTREISIGPKTTDSELTVPVTDISELYGDKTGLTIGTDFIQF